MFNGKESTHCVINYLNLNFHFKRFKGSMQAEIKEKMIALLLVRKWLVY